MPRRARGRWSGAARCGTPGPVLLEAAAGSFGIDVTGAGIARLPIPVPPPGEEEPLPAEPETSESESPP